MPRPANIVMVFQYTPRADALRYHMPLPRHLMTLTCYYAAAMQHAYACCPPGEVV